MRLETETPETSFKETKEYGVFYGKSLFSEAGSKEPIIEHMLNKNDCIFISAKSGEGKSILALQMMAAMTSGRPFLKAFDVPKPVRVALLQTEGDRSETLERIAAMSHGLEFNHDNWVHINLDGICLNTPEGHSEFKRLLAEPHIVYEVIIIDPLYTTLRGSMNSDDVATEWVRYARGIRRVYPQCSFIIVHHESIKDFYIEGAKVKKSTKDIMGSTYWGSFATYNFKLTYNPSTNIHTLSSGKERNRKVFDHIDMRLLEPDPLLFVTAEDNLSISEAQVLKFIQDCNNTCNVREIMDTTKLSRATCYRVLRNLIEAGKIRKVLIANSNTVTYALPDKKSSETP